MTDAEMDSIHKCVGQSVERTINEAVEHIAERHARIAREVGIALSPFEKFLERRVRVETREQEWDGVLMQFGDGWLEIQHDGMGRVIIHTGVGMTVRIYE